MISRAPFGRNGNRAPSLFNWITQVGFEIVGLVLVVLVVEAMFNKEGTIASVSTGAKVVMIICAVAVQFIAAVPRPCDHQRRCSATCLTSSSSCSSSWQSLSYRTPTWTSLQTGTRLVALDDRLGARRLRRWLGWTENAADYSRYLPRDTPKAKTFWAATLGAAIPSILLELLGAAAYLVSPKVTAAAAVPAAFASWFFWPFLILALPQLFAINSIDMYSSGVTLQAIGIPLKRWGCVLVDTVISGAVTGLVIFKGNFYTDLSGFLDYIVVWLGPWFGILLVDYLLRRGRYDVLSLAEKRGGLYWRNGGFNWKALVSLALGMFAAMMWIDAAYYYPLNYTCPISNATNGSDFSWLFGMIIAAVVYWILSVASVRKEALSSSTQLEAPRL